MTDINNLISTIQSYREIEARIWPIVRAMFEEHLMETDGDMSGIHWCRLEYIGVHDGQIVVEVAKTRFYLTQEDLERY